MKRARCLLEVAYAHEASCSIEVGMSEEQVRAFEGALAAQVDTVRTAVAQLEATVDLAAASCGGDESELALAEILDAITPAARGGVQRRKGAGQETADVEVGRAARQLEAAEAVDACGCALPCGVPLCSRAGVRSAGKPSRIAPAPGSLTPSACSPGR